MRVFKFYATISSDMREIRKSGVEIIEMNLCGIERKCYILQNVDSRSVRYVNFLVKVISHTN